MNFFIPGSYSTGSSSALVFERRKGNNNIAESNIIVDFAIVLPFTLIDQAFPHPFISPVSRRCVPNPHSTWHMAVTIDCPHLNLQAPKIKAKREREVHFYIQG